MTDFSAHTFPIQFSFKGKLYEAEATIHSTADELMESARVAIFGSPGTAVGGESEGQRVDRELKLLYKGKRLIGNTEIFESPPKSASPQKIIVMATTTTAVSELNGRRSDPTIRGFEQEKRKEQAAKGSNSLLANGYWGPLTAQDKNCKFCRFQPCTWQSFGHRPDKTSTPHDFAALHLLEKLATDPGIVAVLKERELVVTTLGEMDPIDDRLMQKTQEHKGMCLLGYNTNAGARIDIKLRTDDLRGFRPYQQLAATLIHELSHNWVGEHNLLFWTNYGQMRVEYIAQHILGAAATTGTLVNGKSTAQLAELPSSLKSMADIFVFAMNELGHEMAMHGLDARIVESAIRQRCDEWEKQNQQQAPISYSASQRLGNGGTNGKVLAIDGLPPREASYQAAERRRLQAQEQQDSPSKPPSEHDDTPVGDDTGH